MAELSLIKIIFDCNLKFFPLYIFKLYKAPIQKPSSVKKSQCNNAIRSPHSYPSRAAYKLRYALDLFREQYQVEIQDRICIDLGSAQGGFVQVLLEEGARRVYAVDVAYGLLDYKLRKDERVIARERHNLRHLEKSWFIKEDLKRLSDSEQPLFLSCDAAFISARTVLEVLRQFRKESKIPIEVMLLVKPQFEDSKSTQKGIVREPALREKLLNSVKQKAKECAFHLLGSVQVCPKGAQGNQEYMLYLNLFDI